MKLYHLHEDELDKWDIEDIKRLNDMGLRPGQIASKLRIHVDEIKKVLEQDKQSKPKLFSTSSDNKFWDHMRALSPEKARKKISAMAHKSADNPSSRFYGKDQKEIWRILWASAIKNGVQLQ